MTNMQKLVEEGFKAGWLVATEGCGILESPGMEPVTLAKGDAAVVPASVSTFAVRPQWAVSFLKAYVPGTNYPDPETRL